MLDTDPQNLHAERFDEISRIIERDTDRLIAHWAAQALVEQPDADPDYRAEMHDRLPAFLRAVAESLRRSDGDQGRHRLLALEHGEQRWHAGWKLAEVVRDYQILRLAVVNHLDKSLDRPLATREVMAIGLLLDEAIAAAVVMFVAQHEHRLGQAERRIRDVMDTVADGIMMLDSQGRVVLLNPAAERIFGRQADDMLGADLRHLVTFPEADARVAWQQLLPDDGAVAGTTRKQAHGLRADGTRFELEMTVTGFQRDERKHWIVVARDITEQKRLENELKRGAHEQQMLNQSLARLSAEADASNRAKSEFLANMSHEIRTPMTAILGYVELLRGELREPGQLRAVETIQRNADFLLEIINDLLDLSKIEANKFDLEVTQVAPPELLAEVAALMAIRARAQGIQLNLTYPERIPASIRTDPLRLKQILINLVGNAIKFTDQGEVRIVVSLSLPQAEIAFAVTDTGIGMSPEDVERVFQPFMQGETAASRRPGGTGLGLTISRHLAELLGGRLEVESQLGAGSTFRLILPLGPMSAAELVPPPPAGPPHMPAPPEPVTPRSARPLLECRVLAADDRRDNQLLIERMLSNAGARVTIASDGRTAVAKVLEAAAQGPGFDVVLMDMQMPDVDGYEATRQLRSAGCSVPIIALTASAMIGDQEECLLVGCDDYLAKPIDFGLLVAMVARHAGRQR